MAGQAALIEHQLVQPRSGSSGVPGLSVIEPVNDPSDAGVMFVNVLGNMPWSAMSTSPAVPCPITVNAVGTAAGLWVGSVGEMIVGAFVGSVAWTVFTGIVIS